MNLLDDRFIPMFIVGSMASKLKNRKELAMTWSNQAVNFTISNTVHLNF